MANVRNRGGKWLVRVKEPGQRSKTFSFDRETEARDFSARTFRAERERVVGGYWQVQIRRQGYAHVLRTFDSEDEAREFAAHTESEMRRRVYKPLGDAERMTLREALGKYELEKTKEKRGADQESRNVRVLKNDPISSLSMVEVRSQHVAGFIKQQRSRIIHRRFGNAKCLDGSCTCSRRLGENSIRLYLALLSHLFNIARTEWGMEALDNPVAALPRESRARPPRHRDRTLRDGEEERLLDAARSLGSHHEALVVLAIETAWRRADFLRLRWGDLHFDEGVASLPWTKTGARRAPLSPRAIETLKGLIPVNDTNADEQVFVWRNEDSITHAFEDIRERAKVQGLTLHDLKHEALTRKARLGWSLPELSVFSGNSFATLHRYVNLRAEDIVAKLAHESDAAKDSGKKE